MKTSIFRKLLAVGLAGLMAGTSGCTSGLTTSLVWRKNLYHPAATPRLCLMTSPQKDDVLVEYDECFAQSENVRPRSYWLLAYAASINNPADPPKPKFVNPADCENLAPVPRVCSDGEVATNGYCFKEEPGLRSFVLWHDGAMMGTCSLPVYSNAPPVTVGRVVLTPLTVTTDAAIIAAILFCLGAGGAGGGAR
ncbi:MAG TPA: hypothetical protein VL863_11630 [bacterium]|nr:hypothetical protein [bacterium]